MINEGYMAEIDMIVDDYKDFCKKYKHNPSLRGCVHYLKQSTDIVNNDGDNEAELYELVRPIFNDKFGVNEAIKIVKGFGYRVINEADETEDDDEVEIEIAPLDGESDEIKTMVRELADYTGNDYSDAEVEYNEGPGSLAVQVTFGNEEYYCYEDYSDAEKAAQEDCKELFDDIGIEGIRFVNIGGIENFVDTGWFEDARKESAESYVYDIHDSDPDRYEEEFGDMDVDDAVEKYLDDDGYENDPVQWFIDNFGKKELEQTVKEYNLIDEDKLAEAIVDADGPANSLARYDGDEISLDCGYYCYRTN